MLLTVQRVQSPIGVTGINVYRYTHPPGPWETADISVLEGSATFVGQELEVPPGENAVRSFLDVFGPEGTTTTELARVASEVRAGPDPGLFPWVYRNGEIVLRLGLPFGLVPSWRAELTELMGRGVMAAARDVARAPRSA